MYKRQIYQIAESNRIETFLPELECSTVHDFCLATPVASSHASRRRIYCVRCFSVDVTTLHALLTRCTFSPTHAPVLNTPAFIQSTMTTPTTVIRLKHDTSFRLVRLSVRAGVPSIGVLRPACGRLLHRESKKTRHQTLGHNFTNYYPIFKIFSLAYSAVNLQQIHV